MSSARSISEPAKSMSFLVARSCRTKRIPMPRQTGSTTPCERWSRRRLIERETLDGKEVVAIFGPGQSLDPEAGIVPQQMVTIEATVRENGRADAESEIESGDSASDASLAAAGIAVESPSS